MSAARTEPVFRLKILAVYPDGSVGVYYEILNGPRGNALMRADMTITYNANVVDPAVTVGAEALDVIAKARRG